MNANWHEGNHVNIRLWIFLFQEFLHGRFTRAIHWHDVLQYTRLTDAAFIAWSRLKSEQREYKEGILRSVEATKLVLQLTRSNQFTITFPCFKFTRCNCRTLLHTKRTRLQSYGDGQSWSECFNLLRLVCLAIGQRQVS